MTENVNETVEVSVNSVADATEEKQTKSTTQSFRTKNEINNLIQQRMNGTDNGALSWIENCCINLIKNNTNLVIGKTVCVISIKSKNDIVIYKSFFKEKSGDRVFNIQEILKKENFNPTKIEKVYVFNESGSNLPEDLESNIENIKEDIVISEYNTESNLEEGLKYFNIGINNGQPVNIYVNGNKSKLDNTKGDITLQKDSSGKYIPPKIEIKEPKQIEIKSDNIFKDISDDDELQLSYMIDGHQYLYLKTSKGRCSACVHVWSGRIKYYSDANACTGEILKGKKTISLITESGNRDTSDAKQKHILTDNTVSLNLDNYKLDEKTQKSMLTSAIINGEVQKTLTVTLTLLRKVAYKFIDSVYPNQRVGKLWDTWISSTAIWDAYKVDHEDWETFSNPKIPESNTEMMDWGNYDVFINNHKEPLISHWGIQNRFTIKNNIIRIKDHVRNISSHQQSHNLEPDAVFDAITYMREIVDIFKCKEISKELLNYQKRLIKSFSLDTFKEEINICLDKTLKDLREKAYNIIDTNIISNNAIDEINTVGQWYDNVLETQGDDIPKKYKDDWANFKNDNEDWQKYNNGRKNKSYNTRMLNWGNYYIYINEFWDNLQNEKHTLKDCTQKLAKLVKKKDDKPYNYELKDNIKDTEIYNAITYLREILRALNIKLESLNELHVSLVEFATSADTEELNNKLKTVESRNAKLAEQLEEVSKDKESLTKELNNKLETIKGEKNELAEQLSAANKIIEELKGKICPTSSVVTTQPVAYIIFGDTSKLGDTSKQYVLPIYDNKVNYYATLNAKDIVIKNNSVSEDEILKIPRNSLSDVKIAFKIEKSNNSKNLYLKDLVGNLTFPLSDQSENSYRLSNNSIFYVEGNGTKFTGKYSRL